MNAPVESVPVIQADRDARSEILRIMKDAIEAGGEKVMQAQDRIDEALARHRTKGDTLLIITATNRFITGPIAERLGVDNLIAVEPEMVNGRYTGRVDGVPSYREGKVIRLQAWLEAQDLTMDGAWFYSDSHNDLPLLEKVDHPVAVDPDDTLRQVAEERNWRIMSLRD
jgi:HAD superfamily hydrolase (TIGR01490 family)